MDHLALQWWWYVSREKLNKASGWKIDTRKQSTYARCIIPLLRWPNLTSFINIISHLNKNKASVLLWVTFSVLKREAWVFYEFDIKAMNITSVALRLLYYFVYSCLNTFLTGNNGAKPTFCSWQSLCNVWSSVQWRFIFIKHSCLTPLFIAKLFHNFFNYFFK